jgi:hypothetical protein
VPLLAPAVQDRYGAVLTAQEQRPDAVRAADLVARDGHRGEARGAEVDGDLTEGLDGVGVQRDVELPCHVCQFTDRHDRADLVVRPHHGREGDVFGAARDGLAEGLGVNAAVPVHGEVLDRGALVLAEPVDRVEDGVVLHGAREDPGAGRVGVAAGPVQALHREVVGLGAAGGEDHLARAGTQGVREGFAALLDRPAGAAAGCVQGGCVAGDGELRGHCLDRLREHRGGRGVVEVCHGRPDSRARYPMGWSGGGRLHRARCRVPYRCSCSAPPTRHPGPTAVPTRSALRNACPQQWRPPASEAPGQRAVRRHEGQ